MDPLTQQHHFPLSAARKEFHRARLRGALAEMGARFTGKSMELLSYEEVVGKLRVTGRSTRGVESIPLNAIVGSVGRYNDFTRTFLPRLRGDAERWAAVRLAGPVAELPAIEVYRVGDAYFVLDGNHRVSIALQDGLEYIDAYVTEVRTRVPLAPGDDPNTLIVKAEYAAFLEHTGLDRLRPDVDLTVSVAGQYETLENLIEVHRFFIEMEEEVALSDEEAVCRWADEAYLPAVTAVREQGVLRYFPGRTETDFYVWLALHQAHLRSELGWDLPPQSLVRVAHRFEPRAPRAKPLARRILETVSSAGEPAVPVRRWSEERLLDRYSGSLFQEVLVPLPAGASPPSWHTVVELARREGAQLLALATEPGPEPGEALGRACAAASIPLQIGREVAGTAAAVCRRAALADLIFVHGAFDGAWVRELLTGSPRPVLLAAASGSRLQRVLLAYDDSPRAREALFVVAYLAEQWAIDLVVCTALESSRLHGVAAHASRYLALHEVSAAFDAMEGPAPAVLRRMAAIHRCDLIVLGGSGGAYPARRRVGSTVEQLLDAGEHSLLICP